MTTKLSTVRFRLAGVQAHIIQRESPQTVLTQEAQQQLPQLSRNLHHLFQTDDVEVRRWSCPKADEVDWWKNLDRRRKY